MLDIRTIRENAAGVKQAIQNRGLTLDLDKVIDCDRERRDLLLAAETLKNKRNVVSKEIGVLKKSGADAAQKMDEMRAVGGEIAGLDEKIRQIEEDLQKLLLTVPNIPHATTPVGQPPEANREVKRWGEPRQFAFKPLAHWDIAENLDIVDLKRATKITASHFILFKGAGARLERALVNFMIDLHIQKHGYTEISPPFVVNRQSMTGTGQLPKLEDDMYRIERDDFFLIPTAEVPVTNIFRDEILEEKDLPIRYAAYTPCFRREAGSYGKDTRGMTRVHQFDKVEMVKFVAPETSYDEHEKLLQDAEDVLQLLKIPYRVISLCTGDISFAAAKCYDIEAWSPGQNAYLEVSSCSNFEDFQARRAGIRFRRAKDRKIEFVHTLNASGVALARTFIAIVENYQNEDGSVTVPEVLRPYMGGIEKIERIKGAV
ncbi:MAG TPA: serine--tRNA ligase [bacterium]|nr:serine--tRNA ligase [bacterium]